MHFRNHRERYDIGKDVWQKSDWDITDKHTDDDLPLGIKNKFTDCPNYSTGRLFFWISAKSTKHVLNKDEFRFDGIFIQN